MHRRKIGGAASEGEIVAGSELSGYWKRRVDRRRALRGGALGLAGLASAALIACGGNESGSSSSSATGGTSGTNTTGAAGAGATAAKIKTGGRLRTTLTGDPGALDPDTSRGSVDPRVFWTMIENLVAYNQKG